MQIIVTFVAYAVVLGPDCHRFCRSCGEVPAIQILLNTHWDFGQRKILEPLWTKIVDAVEKMQAGLKTKLELGKGTGWAGKGQGVRWWYAGDDARWKEAGWKAAAKRTDRRMPMSLFDDVHVVSDAMLGWYAVFYTTVLGYDKSVVIK